MTDDVKLEPTAEEIERVAVVISEKVPTLTLWIARIIARAAILAMDRRASPPAPAEAAGKACAWRYRHSFNGQPLPWQTTTEQWLADREREKGAEVEALGVLTPAPAVAVPEGWKPSPTQIASACLSYRHDFGLLDKEEQSRLVFEATEWLHAWGKELAAAPQPPATNLQNMQIAPSARPIEEWHDDDGFVVWWSLDPKVNDWVGQPSYIGSPLCDDWAEGCHTHWTPHPAFPPVPAIRSLADEPRHGE